METIRKMWNDYKVRKIPENNMSLQNQHALNSFNNNMEGLLIKTWIISEVFIVLYWVEAMAQQNLVVWGHARVTPRARRVTTLVVNKARHSIVFVLSKLENV